MAEIPQQPVNYLEKAENIASAHHLYGRSSELVSQLEQLSHQARLLDDSIHLYHAWQKRMSVKLHENYSEEEFLNLHGITSETAELTHHGDFYFIFEGTYTLCRFIFCSHQNYTPIYQDGSFSHQCLEC